jgi:hypothetical protein
MAVLAGKLEARREECAPVAGKSTLNRLELSKLEPMRYHKISHNPHAIKRLLVDLFLAAHEQAQNEIILDVDAIQCMGSRRESSSTGYKKNKATRPLRAPGRATVVPISELVFRALTQNRSSLEPSLGFAAIAGTPRIENGGTFAAEFADGAQHCVCRFSFRVCSRSSSERVSAAPAQSAT